MKNVGKSMENVFSILLQSRNNKDKFMNGYIIYEDLLTPNTEIDVDIDTQIDNNWENTDFSIRK